MCLGSSENYREGGEENVDNIGGGTLVWLGSSENYREGGREENVDNIGGAYRCA